MVERTGNENSNSGSALKAETPAPDFTLSSGPDEKLSLSDFRGRPVILAFYPADWSPVCGDQMALYNEVLPEFKRFNAELLGVSVDGVWCHRAYREHRNLHFRLLSDFEPKGEVARTYGVYRHGEGVTERALEEPLRQIAQNAGQEGSIVVEKVRGEGSPNFGFNAQTEKYEDLVKAGVIDPTKVARTALQNATSIASLLLTTEAVVAEVPEEKKKGSGPPMPGGDMDY